MATNGKKLMQYYSLMLVTDVVGNVKGLPVHVLQMNCVLTSNGR
jgi:hypothetical protein